MSEQIERIENDDAKSPEVPEEMQGQSLISGNEAEVESVTTQVEEPKAERGIDPKQAKEKDKSFFHTLIVAVTFLILALNGTFLLLQDSENFVIVGFRLILLFTVSLLMTGYYYFYQREAFKETKSVILLSCFILLGTLPSLYLVGHLPYLMPLLLVIMLTATVFHQDIALMYGFGAVLIVVTLGKMDWVDILIYLIMILLSHQLLPFIRKRKNILYIALTSSVSFGVLVLAGHLAKTGVFQNFHWLNMVYAMLNGLVSVIFLLGSLPLWESAFDVVTPHKLMELSNTNNEMLQRLLREAPGTYHHSLMVANLAEKASIDLELDALLVRTGAMYHDIGKLKNPQYFIENQNGENPHDLLPPRESAKIIIDHVEEGIVMAKKLKLPKTVISFIREHHGDRLVGYFYQKAQNQAQSLAMTAAEGIEVLVEDYRYKGPKPQSKETAIVMMADVCEATIKSIPEQERSLEKIEQVIEQITTHLVTEKQLIESGLSFREFDKAKESFLAVYRGLYHERISYGSIK